MTIIGNKGASPPVIPTDFRLNGQSCTTGTRSAALRARSGAALARLAVTPPAMQGCSVHAPSPPARIGPGEPLGAVAPRSPREP